LLGSFFYLYLLNSLCCPFSPRPAEFLFGNFFYYSALSFIITPFFLLPLFSKACWISFEYPFSHAILSAGPLLQGLQDFLLLILLIFACGILFSNSFLFRFAYFYKLAPFLLGLQDSCLSCVMLAGFILVTLAVPIFLRLLDSLFRDSFFLAAPIS